MQLIYLLSRIPGIHQPAFLGIREPRTANHKPFLFFTCQPFSAVPETMRYVYS